MNKNELLTKAKISFTDIETQVKRLNTKSYLSAYTILDIYESKLKSFLSESDNTDIFIGECKFAARGIESFKLLIGKIQYKTHRAKNIKDFKREMLRDLKAIIKEVNGNM